MTSKELDDEFFKSVPVILFGKTFIVLDDSFSLTENDWFLEFSTTEGDIVLHRRRHGCSSRQVRSTET